MTKIYFYGFLNVSIAYSIFDCVHETYIRYKGKFFQKAFQKPDIYKTLENDILPC